MQGLCKLVAGQHGGRFPCDPSIVYTFMYFTLITASKCKHSKSGRGSIFTFRLPDYLEACDRILDVNFSVPIFFSKTTRREAKEITSNYKKQEAEAITRLCDMEI